MIVPRVLWLCVRCDVFYPNPPGPGARDERTRDGTNYSSFPSSLVPLMFYSLNCLTCSTSVLYEDVQHLSYPGLYSPSPPAPEGWDKEITDTTQTHNLERLHTVTQLYSLTHLFPCSILLPCRVSILVADDGGICLLVSLSFILALVPGPGGLG